MRLEFLSYILNRETPTYGDRERFNQFKKSSISSGDVANNTSIETTTHIGTHIDMPYHFYEDGKSIEDYPASFWHFSRKEILYIELRVKNLIVKDELISKLKDIKNHHRYKILIVKTNICAIRGEREFWAKNYGFSPDIYDYLIKNFPNIKIFGFDTISISSFANRAIGREAHKRFLNPKREILLLEDMNLCRLDRNRKIKELTIAPLRIKKSDGIPCSIIAKIKIPKVKNILWDFDGVIFNSMKIKNDGFLELFKGHKQEDLEKFREYNYISGGVPRFDKIRYFYNDILKEDIRDDEVKRLADEFAKIIRNRLFLRDNLIADSIEFIKREYKNYNFHITSGAEHNELNRLCREFNLSKYFISIEGSPTKKSILIENILRNYGYSKKDTILIGDAITDYYSAYDNGIGFYGYNNPELKKFFYIESFKDFKI